MSSGAVSLGVRDVLAHGCFQVNPEELFRICRDDVPNLIDAVRSMLESLE